jgi:hypothetical protein
MTLLGGKWNRIGLLKKRGVNNAVVTRIAAGVVSFERRVLAWNVSQIICTRLRARGLASSKP